MRFKKKLVLEFFFVCTIELFWTQLYVFFKVMAELREKELKW